MRNCLPPSRILAIERGNKRRGSSTRGKKAKKVKKIALQGHFFLTKGENGTSLTLRMPPNSADSWVSCGIFVEKDAAMSVKQR